MTARPPVLPLRNVSGNRSLAGFIGVMVFVGVMVAAVFVGGESRFDHLSRDADGRITVLLSPPDANSAAATVEDAIAILDGFSGIARAEPLSRAEIITLVTPWVAPGHDVDALPLPNLIDVTLAKDKPLDLEVLRAKLGALGDGVQIDDHGSWLRLHVTSGYDMFIAVGAILLAAVAVVYVVAMTIRGSLDAHWESIATLQWIGASDGFIASQFQGQVARQGLTGGVLGLMSGLVCLAAVKLVSDTGSSTWTLPHIDPNAPALAAMFVVACAIVAIAIVAARVTVLRALARIA